MAKEKKGLKTVIITGGGSGIGLSTARALLARGGFRIALIGKSKSRLESAFKELGSSDLISTYSYDLAKCQGIEGLVEKIAATHTSIWGLVNNAGVYPFGGLSSTKESEWDETFNINLKSVFLLTKYVCPLMIKEKLGGRVINISSTAGLLPNHFALAYSVSKAAMIQFTKTIAKELGKDGITANCVCPGIVRTPLHEKYHHNKSELESFYAKRGAAFPMGRVGEPEDVSSAIMYFLSPESQWVTGDVFVVDGGRLLI